eukprot:3281624-Lingulodinium_polyedra.AAC.1
MGQELDDLRGHPRRRTRGLRRAPPVRLALRQLGLEREDIALGLDPGALRLLPGQPGLLELGLGLGLL